MKRTTSLIPYNPQSIGVDYPFAGSMIKCRAGRITVGKVTYDVAAKTVTPHKLATKLAITQIWLVKIMTGVSYHVEKSIAGDFASRNLRPLVRLAYIEIPAGKTLADADGQIVDVQPMIETVYKKQIDKDGKPLTKHVTEKFPDGSVVERDVPLMEQVEKVITV